MVCSVDVNKIRAADKIKSQSRLILVFGGDGTMIGSVRSLYFNIPFLVNSGTIGFLTDLSINKITTLTDILKGHYIKENRSILRHQLPSRRNFLK